MIIHCVLALSPVMWLSAIVGNRPEELPSDPYSMYKGHGWVSWRHFLGYDDEGEDGDDLEYSSNSLRGSWDDFADPEKVSDYR